MNITPTMQTFYFLVLLLILSSCSESQTNVKKYSIKVGETFEIYYTSNSCCDQCWNVDQLETIELLDTKTIEESDLAGGTSKYAKIFRGVRTGTDTLRTHTYQMSDSCNLNSEGAEEYIIHVSK